MFVRRWRGLDLLLDGVVLRWRRIDVLDPVFNQLLFQVRVLGRVLEVVVGEDVVAIEDIFLGDAVDRLCLQNGKVEVAVFISLDFTDLTTRLYLTYKTRHTLWRPNERSMQAAKNTWRNTHRVAGLLMLRQGTKPTLNSSISFDGLAILRVLGLLRVNLRGRHLGWVPILVLP